jgi:tetratricopeptide (TPR) repeat protein
MWDLAVREEDNSGVDAMLARYHGRPPLSTRLLPAAARSDTEAVRALLEEGRGLESRQLQIAGRYAASYLQDMKLADSLARLDLAWRTRPVNRAGAQMLLAGLAAAGGRWTAARDAFATAETMEDAGQVPVQRALVATLPLQPVPREDLQLIRADVERWVPSPASEGTSLSAALEPHLRLYLLGLLSSRLGDADAAWRAVAEFERVPAPPGGERVVRGLAATMRADIAWTQGRTRDVLAFLERVDFQIPLELVALSRAAHVREYGLEHARFLLATGLAEMGRHADALAWFRFGLRGSPQEYLYHGPVHLGLARLFEQMSQPDSAAAHYDRFVRLWGNADSSASAMLEQARTGVARLRKDVHP